MKKAIIASDSFKGSLSSAQVACSAVKAIHSIYPECEVTGLQVADGGEGTLDALLSSSGAEIHHIGVSDPLGRTVIASYGIYPDRNGRRTALIEMASASGITLLKPEELNPMIASTYGTGELVMDTIAHGCRKVIVGIGGSATNDAGTGMLAAMGFRFLDRSGNPLVPCGGSLEAIASIDDSMVSPELRETEFAVACDVDTPFCGPEGAAYVFAPQKGADAAMVEELEQGMQHFAAVIEDYLAVRGQEDRTFRKRKGTGAAGGLGGAFLAFLGARLESGAELVLDTLDFDQLLEGADLVITGEGKIDVQTLKGKTPYCVMLHAVRKGIPVLALCGQLDLPLSGYDGVHPCFLQITPQGQSLQEAMSTEVAGANLERSVREILASGKIPAVKMENLLNFFKFVDSCELKL